MSNQENLEDRKIELKLFSTIAEWESRNKRTKEYADKQMQERIKKLIENTVKAE